jgi:hypothetical protein
MRGMIALGARSFQARTLSPGSTGAAGARVAARCPPATFARAGNIRDLNGSDDDALAKDARRNVCMQRTRVRAADLWK